MIRRIGVVVVLLCAFAAGQNSLSDLRSTVSRLETLLNDYPDHRASVLPDLNAARTALISRLQSDWAYFSSKNRDGAFQKTLDEIAGEIAQQKTRLTMISASAGASAPGQPQTPPAVSVSSNSGALPLRGPETQPASAGGTALPNLPDAAMPAPVSAPPAASLPAGPGQPPESSECSYTDELQKIKKLSPGSTQRQSALNKLLKPRANAACFKNLFKTNQGFVAQQIGFSTFVKTLETLRTDKQGGSSSGTGGTTSVVSKGITARVLSMAAEYGAMRETFNNQVVTFQGSLEGIPAVLVRHNLFSYCPSDYSTGPGCIKQPVFDFLRRISYGVSFNTTQNGQTVTGTPAGGAQGSAQPVTFTANQRQLASVSGRVLLWSTRDAKSKEFEKRWTEQVKQATDVTSAGVRLTDQLDSLLGNLEDSPEFAAWFEQAKQDLSQAGNADLDAQWRVESSKLIDLVKRQNPTIAENAAAFDRALRAFRFEEDTLVESIANKPVLTFEYNNNRPVGQDPTSTFRLIFDKGINKWAITANGAFEIYDSRTSTAVPGSSRLRDAQLGIQVDRNLGSLAFLGTTAMTAAYYFQYQNSPAILNVTPGTPLPGITFIGLPATATQAFAQKGNLHIFQWKLVLGEGSVRFPLSVSYSNRTELIAKPTWRGQLGISYDFDSLFAKP